MQQAGWVAIGLFMVGVIYHAGYMSARVALLIEWRQETMSSLKEIAQLVNEIRGAIFDEVKGKR